MCMATVSREVVWLLFLYIFISIDCVTCDVNRELKSRNYIDLFVVWRCFFSPLFLLLIIIILSFLTYFVIAAWIFFFGHVVECRFHFFFSVSIVIKSMQAMEIMSFLNEIVFEKAFVHRQKRHNDRRIHIK